MKINHEWLNEDGVKSTLITLDTIIIGTGCAGFNAADALYDFGRRDIAIISEGVNMGTSRNTGSDKQTYYKLSLASDSQDSIYELAKNLYNGGAVNGDVALAEAACSVRSFMKLVNIGVNFPTNRFGEYVGYKTDHDPYQRATSCGPLTSKIMTERLEESVNKKGIRLFDGMQAVRLITKNSRVHGVICIDLANTAEDIPAIVVFSANNVIMATGGPAAIYSNSVYPESQTGMTGMALEAGADGSNLSEWQYGLASTKFRWNVSGTYQQVLPKYIAVDKDLNQREFLPEYFSSPQKALDMVFLKGYQWPFDVKKIDGSSIIDLIIHHEIFDKGNRVYMDFRTNPTGIENGFDLLSEETHTYLLRSNALQETPIKRLAAMNPKAIKLYADHGIDLYSEPLEVSVCAQHNNGGIDVDINWESGIKHLYVCGEAAGTFGIYRPGGSALNSTQVGSLRAAEHIAYFAEPALTEVAEILLSSAKDFLKEIKGICVGTSNVIEKRQLAQRRMSEYAAHLRNLENIERLYCELRNELESFYENIKISSCLELPHALKNRDMLITQLCVLSAAKCSAEKAHSRGSGLLISSDGIAVCDALQNFKYIKGDDNYNNMLIKTRYSKNNIVSEFKKVRDLPKTDDWFENVWNEYNRRFDKDN